MTPWQRRARLVIAVSAIAFGLFVAFAFKRRADAPPPVAVQPLESGAVVVTLAERAVVHMMEESGATTDITSGTTTFDRRQHVRRFERSVRMQRGAQATEADSATAYLNEDSTRIERIELRGGTHIAIEKA